MRLTALTLLVASFITAAPAQVRGFAIDSIQDVLYAIDPGTGAFSRIGPTGSIRLRTPSGLAFRPDTDELWTVDLNGGELGTLDRSTGQFTEVFNTGVSGFQSIAWDPVMREFLLIDQIVDLYAFRPATRTLRRIGRVSSGLVTGATVLGDGRLLAVDFRTGDLLEVDRATGAGRVISSTHVTAMQSLGQDRFGRLFGISTDTDGVYFIDPTSGQATSFVTLSGVSNISGFEIEAFNVGYGTPCRSPRDRLFTGERSRIGSFAEFFVAAPAPVGAISLGFSQTAWGPVPLPVRLDALGAPGCELLQSLDLVFPTLPGTVENLPVPADPGLVGGVVFTQALLLDPAVNALGLYTTNGIRLVVGG